MSNLDNEELIATRRLNGLEDNLFKENKLPKNVRDRCCNFVLLEVKSEEYNSINYVVN